MLGEEAHTNMESLAPKIGSLAAEFNSRYESEGVFPVLEDLSFRLGVELDSLFPRMDSSGHAAEKTLENQMWALDLIVANWEAWVRKSKSIQHHGHSNPKEESILEFLVQASKEQAFNLGKERAMKEKAGK